MAVMMKFWRRQSMDSFLSDAITYGKSAVALMVWYMDWRICIYYCLLYIGGLWGCPWMQVCVCGTEAAAGNTVAP